MKFFNVRNSQVFISDGTQNFNTALVYFVQLEEGFVMPTGVIQIEYHPESKHYEQINNDGTIQKLTPPWVQGDQYIAKIATYIAGIKNININSPIPPEPTPATLADAKTLINGKIYTYAASLTNDTVQQYSPAERERWSSIIIPEAQAYLASTTEDLTVAPNLVAQEKLRKGDIADADLKESLKIRCQGIITKSQTIQTALNNIAGLRGKHSDAVNAYNILPGETEPSAIARLMKYNWKDGWS